MKKIILSILLLMGLTATAQVASLNPVDTVHFHGNGLLTIQRGDRNYLSYAADANASVIQTGRSLAITDHRGGAYTLFLNQDTLDMLYVNLYGDGLFTIDGVTCRNMFQLSSDSPDLALSLDKFRTSGIVDTLFSSIQRLNDITQHRASQKEQTKSGKKKQHYSYSDRRTVDFLWGFTNWGTEPLNGLMGMSDPNYDIRTSFSAYALEYRYAFVRTKNFALFTGVGYTSDVFKYRQPYAELSDGALALVADPTKEGYQSRVVVRSFTLPTGLEFSPNGKFSVSLAAISGLNFNGARTGLKHVYRSAGHKNKDFTQMGGLVNPYKLDLRATFWFNNFGVYIQAPTQPLFIGENMPKVYPIKLGFCI